MLNAGFISILCEELKEALVGARIDKIRQPAKDVVLLDFRSRSIAQRLLLSASPGKARAHLTEMSYENPSEPTLFCTLLRKHLSGAVLTDIAQPGGDRVLSFSFSAFDDLGRETPETLVVEMIPGKTNIILIGSDGLIVDCAYRRDYEADLYRHLAPGMIYRFPLQPEGFIQPAGEPGY